MWQGMCEVKGSGWAGDGPRGARGALGTTSGRRRYFAALRSALQTGGQGRGRETGRAAGLGRIERYCALLRGARGALGTTSGRRRYFAALRGALRTSDGA